jgi:hypothetical protein
VPRLIEPLAAGSYLEQAADGYKAMDERQAIKTLLILEAGGHFRRRHPWTQHLPAPWAHR